MCGTNAALLKFPKKYKKMLRGSANNADKLNSRNYPDKCLKLENTVKR